MKTEKEFAAGQTAPSDLTDDSGAVAEIREEAKIVDDTDTNH